MDLFVDPRMYTNRGSALEKSSTAKDEKALKNVCQEFEAVMVQTMFKSMRGAQEQDGLVEKGMADDIYQDLFDSEVARELAHSQSMGIGQKIYQQLQRNQ
jgi:flagellar protein FlgJ